MAPDSSFADYIVSDLFSRIPGVSHRSMFGGFGIYKDGVMFALITDDKLYLKVDDTNRAKFEAEGCGPFTYAKGNHPPTTMSYYELLAEFMEDAVGVEPWVLEAYEVAVRAKKK